MWETFAVHLPVCIGNVAEIIEKVGHWGIFKAQKIERNLPINVTCIHMHRNKLVFSGQSAKRLALISSIFIILLCHNVLHINQFNLNAELQRYHLSPPSQSSRRRINSLISLSRA